MDIWNESWLNLNAQRVYPLMDQCTGSDVTKAMTIPNNLLVGFSLAVPHQMQIPMSDGSYELKAIEPSGFYISRLTVSPAGVTIDIAYQVVRTTSTFSQAGGLLINAAASSGWAVDVASVGVAAGSDVNTTIVFEGKSPFDYIAGHAIFGDVDDTIARYPGSWSFSPPDTRLLPTCIDIMTLGIRSLKIQEGAHVSQSISGDVILRSGSNVSLSLASSDSDTNDVIIINGISSEGFTGTCDECSNLPSQAEPLRYINGYATDQIVAGDCINVAASGSGIQIDDTCAVPCCGCEELAVLTTKSDALEEQLRIVSRINTEVGAAVRGLELSVLGSQSFLLPNPYPEEESSAEGP